MGRLNGKIVVADISNAEQIKAAINTAPVVLLLASKDSQYVTGSSLTAAGGWIIDSAR